nr:hypothetical protein [Lachnospiraceae bacterium]
YSSAYFGYYLDLSDGEENAEWRWVTDEDIDYENFYETEPNRENPGEIYAMFYYKFTDGTWNDGDFGHKTNSGGKAYICEWDD